VLVGPRSFEDERGYRLITPLLRFAKTDPASGIKPEDAPLVDGVLVDRGFISEKHIDRWKACASDDGEELATEVEVLGILRDPPRPNSFTPNNNPEAGEWYWIDLNAMTSHALEGKDESDRSVRPIFVEAIFTGDMLETKNIMNRGDPLPRPATVDLPNMHASYAATWCASFSPTHQLKLISGRFSLSALTWMMFTALLRRRKAWDVYRVR